MSSSTLNHKELAKDMTERAINSIQLQIQSQTIQISEKKLDVDPIIKSHKEAKIKKQAKHPPTLDQLNQIRQEKILELRQIENQTIEIKKHDMLSKSKASKSCKKLWKSDLTEQDINQIKTLLKKQRKYQKQLKKKQKKLEEWVNQKRLQDQELKKQQLSEKCQLRKKELAKQREELQKKKRQRTQLLEEEIKKIKQKKNNKLLYLQMLDSYKKYQETSEKERDRLLQMQRQRKRVDAKQIKQHEAKYLQKKKEQERKREKVLEQSHFHLPYIHSHCQLFHRVQEQEENRIRQKELKIRQVQENVFKRKEYGKNLNQLLLSSVKVKRNKDSREKTNQKKPKSKSPLKLQEQHKLGNNYMKAIHQKITNEDLEKMKRSLKIPQAPAGGISIKYKNYLQDMKPHQKENKGTLEAVEHTLNNKSMDEIDKLHKVKMLFQKDQRDKKSDSEWFDTLKSKMNVLSKLMN